MAGSSPVATSLADGARRGDDAAHDVTVGSDDDCAVAGVAFPFHRRGRKDRDNDGHDPLQGSRRGLARSLTPTVTQRELLAAITA